MKAIAWGTWIAALAVGISLLSQSPLDQRARNLAEVQQQHSQMIGRSVRPLEGKKVDALREISRSLSSSPN